MMANPAPSSGTLTSARVLVRNTIWNAVGQVLPVPVALVTIPILIAALGADKFGVLALAWMVVGYFGFLDFGLGRALTKLVAEELGRGASAGIAPLVWTALALMAALGVLGAAVAAALTPWLVGSVLSIPPGLIPETRSAFYLLSLSIPFVMVVAGFRGLLEAYQRFGVVNALKVPMGVFTYAGPAVTVYWSRRIDVIVAVLVAGRILAALAHFYFCRKMVPSIGGPPTVDRRLIGPLVGFGGWMTVSNVVGPLMVYFDRFLIGGQISMSAVAHYVTPYEVVTKLAMIPGALVGVLFPAFSGTIRTAPERAISLLERGVLYVLIAMFPAVVVIVTLAEPGLQIWLGPEFASGSYRVLQWLAAGVFLNGLAQIPFAFVQGAGRPDLTAKLHFLELPLYLALLWWAVQEFGIVGAAVVWVARVGLDAAILFAMARMLARGRVRLLGLAAGTGSALAIFLLGALVPGTGWRVAFLAVVLGSFFPVAWRWIIPASDRVHARDGIRALLRG